MRAEPTEQILPHYLAELAYLRTAGAAFAQRYPQVAGRLALDAAGSADPHVERLIESFAFLTARLRRLHDAQVPEIARSLLDVVQPGLVAPVPSMAIAEFAADPRQARSLSGLTVPAGTSLFAQAGEGVTVRWRTGMPVALWPVRIEAADLLPPMAVDAAAELGEAAVVLRLRLACQGNRHFGEFTPPSLRIFLGAPHGLGPRLHDLLVHRLDRLLVADPESGKVLRTMPVRSVHAVGLEPAEALLPQPAQVHDGCRLLQEYLAMPAKFLFVDVLGLAEGPGLGIGRAVDLLFALTASPPAGTRVDPTGFRLGCTPIVNLFRCVSEPIRLDLTRLEHRLEADSRRPRTVEIHSIEEVSATSGRGGKRAVHPYFSVTHEAAADPATAFWTARREPTAMPGAAGTDVVLTFVDEALAPAQPPAAALFARLLCTNRGLAEHVPAGVRLDAEVDAPIAAVTCVTRPTPQQPAATGGAQLWRLVSQLSLNHLSLAGGTAGLEALKEILRLHTGPGCEDASRQIAGLVGLEAQRAVRRVGSDAWRGFCRGLAITLEVDDDHFVGASPWLLGAVLNRFLALHAAANSFTELTVTSRQRGRITWPPQSGAALVL